MHVPGLTRLNTLTVTLTVGTLVSIGCARAHRGSPESSRPAPAAPVASEKKTASAPPSLETPAPHPSRAELEAEFDIQQRKVDTAVRKLELEHSVYATERSWGRRTFDQWWPWALKKDRDAIHDLIRDVAEASERQVEIARELKNPDLAVRAEVERDRAEKLLGTLDDFNAHDHNKVQ